MGTEHRWTVRAVALVAGGLCVGQVTLWRQNRRTQVQLEYLTELGATTATQRVDCPTAATEPTSCNKLSADDIRSWITHPKDAAAKAKSTKKPPMPDKYGKLPAADLDALVAYMQSLK